MSIYPASGSGRGGNRGGTIRLGLKAAAVRGNLPFRPSRKVPQERPVSVSLGTTEATKDRGLFFANDDGSLSVCLTERFGDKGEWENYTYDPALAVRRGFSAIIKDLNTKVCAGNAIWLELVGETDVEYILADPRMRDIPLGIVSSGGSLERFGEYPKQGDRLKVWVRLPDRFTSDALEGNVSFE